VPLPGSAVTYGRGMSERRFSHAIAEGDGISVIVAVEDPDAARAAEDQRAEALVVTGDPRAVRGASTLPILWRTAKPLQEAAECADAYLLVFDELDDDDGRLEALHREAEDLGLDCAVEVRDEDEVEKALDRVDPEIFVLSPVDAERDETPLEVVLDLLAAVPAGKLAIADLRLTTPDEVQELERAGCDAVIVHSRDISPLAGAPPPEV
jgi:indole-3-glycerol phosphate synthase